jgi:hypothetical protein
MNIRRHVAAELAGHAKEEYDIVSKHFLHVEASFATRRFPSKACITRQTNDDDDDQMHLLEFYEHFGQFNSRPITASRPSCQNFKSEQTPSEQFTNPLSTERRSIENDSSDLAQNGQEYLRSGAEVSTEYMLDNAHASGHSGSQVDGSHTVQDLQPEAETFLGVNFASYCCARTGSVDHAELRCNDSSWVHWNAQTSFFEQSDNEEEAEEGYTSRKRLRNRGLSLHLSAFRKMFKPTSTLDISASQRSRKPFRWLQCTSPSG